MPLFISPLYLRAFKVEGHPLNPSHHSLDSIELPYYIALKAPTSYVGPAQEKEQRSPMSRMAYIPARRNRVEWDHPALDTRLLPPPFPNPCPLENIWTH